MSELEKRERRAMERKLSEMEEELKVSTRVRRRKSLVKFHRLHYLNFALVFLGLTYTPTHTHTRPDLSLSRSHTIQATPYSRASDWPVGVAVDQ